MRLKNQQKPTNFSFFSFILFQTAFGVPESHLNGHAFHTYALTSLDNTVEFQFQHNVCGRRTYAEGTVDAVGFLYLKMMESEGKKEEQKIFNMIDVLKSGSMR